MVSEIKVLDNKQSLCGKSGFSLTGCQPDRGCGNGLEKIYPTCVVRYGYMRYIGEFRYSPGMLFNCGCQVVVQSNRGIELGEQVSLTCSGCDKSIDRKQMLAYAKRSGPEFMRLKVGKILRKATVEDLDEKRHLSDSAQSKLIHARELAREMGHEMKFVTCEHLLGGERIIFHFMAENRVDFRELVRQLAQEYHTRIEMHQVGARDEARLVADYEICGRECCCKNFLKKPRRINMRMAKLQKATLDPSKVSGRCGRLRCCLRYEHEGYEDLNKKLPRIGARIRTERGLATVRHRQILTQLLSVQFDDSKEIETVAIEEILDTSTGQPVTSAVEQPIEPRDVEDPVHRAEQAGDSPHDSDKQTSREVGESAASPGGGKPASAPTEDAQDDSVKNQADSSDSSTSDEQPRSRRRRRRRRRRRSKSGGDGGATG